MAEDQGLTTQPENDVSLRDMLADNFAEHVETEPAQDAGKTPVTVEAAPAAGETDEQKAGRTAGRARDDQGRLLPGKPAAAAQNQAPPASPLAAQTAAPAAAPAFKRPTTWKAEPAAVLDKFAAGQALTPAESQLMLAELSRREGDYATGISTYKREWDQAKPLIDAVTPFLPQLQQSGIAPAQWITNLGTAHHKLALGQPQEKLAMFQQLMGSYGVPAQLAVQDAQGQWQLLGQLPQQHQAPQPQQPAFNPQDITKLVQQELSNASTQQTIASFEADAPTKYPHYETVKSDMAGLLQANLASDLPSAYEAALRLPKHSAIFDEMQQQQTQAKAAADVAARKATVQRARSNAVSTSSTTPSSSMSASGDKGLRDMIADNVREIGIGRV